jgi:ectoine hydroxylase-related dioxygenase (phytanoyl-CoA dioxygenase family)
MESTFPELVSSADLAGEAGALPGRMAEHGYLLVRRLLPPETVRAARADILDVCRDAGWLTAAGPGEQDQDVVVDPVGYQPPDPRYYAVYNKVISLESYNALAHADPLLRVMKVLLAHEDVIPRPARLARLMFPQADAGATPPHQDYPHEQGTAESYTAWVPLGDIPRELGGLAVWPGSHRAGVFEHGFVPGVGGLGIHTERHAPRWSTTDYQLGDVLLFHSLTVHKALPNRSADRLRISADFRYQRVTDPMAPHMLRPSGGSLDWEDIYAGWRSDELKYYWKRWALTTEPYDQRFYRQRDDEALAAARAGDPLARSFLTTISTRSTDPALRQAAQDLLTELAATGAAVSTPDGDS